MRQRERAREREREREKGEEEWGDERCESETVRLRKKDKRKRE